MEMTIARGKKTFWKARPITLIIIKFNNSTCIAHEAEAFSEIQDKQFQDFQPSQCVILQRRA